jgi:hypothetical protein
MSVWEGSPKQTQKHTEAGPNSKTETKVVSTRARGREGMPLDVINRGYGATAARLTPDQKVGSSNLSALIF